MGELTAGTSTIALANSGKQSLPCAAGCVGHQVAKGGSDMVLHLIKDGYHAVHHGHGTAKLTKAESGHEKCYLVITTFYVI